MSRTHLRFLRVQFVVTIELVRDKQLVSWVATTPSTVTPRPRTPTIYIWPLGNDHFQPPWPVCHHLKSGV